ncbi:hypothetical protein BJ170DRAFT_685979 [Xylariales sp. AK1849]|nr:hypothetical protein BJ170DRAFT_685979 [Xylariales sp. AK1849]
MDKKAGTRASLLSSIEVAGIKAFSPVGTEASRAEGQREFGTLISRTGTPSLISALNGLIKPDRVPRWLRLRLMDILTLMPQRPDGVRATLEFVFATHPSSTVRTSEAADPQKQGANITMEAMKMASTLLAIPPTGVTADKWFPGIAPQLIALLDGKDGVDLVKVAAYVIGYGILGRKQFGAPGTPGWKAFAEPMLAALNPSLSSQDSAGETLVFSAGPDEVVDLQRETVLVQSEDLAVALKRLASLLNSHPNSGLTTRLLSPLLLPLWALSSWPNVDQGCTDRILLPAKNLLMIYLKISGSANKYTSIIRNLLYDGGQLSNHALWRYELLGSQIQIKRMWTSVVSPPAELDWTNLGSKSRAFVRLIEVTAPDADMSQVFLTLFQRSLGSQKAPGGDIQITRQDDNQSEDPSSRLVEAQILQIMMDKTPDRLVADSKGILALASQVLAESHSVSENTDSTAVALSLLNIVITAPSFQRSDVDTDILKSIEASLHIISQANQPDISQTARNLHLLLKYRDEVDDSAERPIAPTDRQVEDRKTYSLALSYITQVDSPPPVRSEGLNLISGLVQANSRVIDVQGVLVLLSSLLSEDDDYINLRVMKIFVQMAEKHPKSVTKELLDHYVDANEEAKVDTRLRFGEAILQVSQRLGDTFSGETARQVGENLLSIAGRRGCRPKTEAKQAREDSLRERQQKAAQKAWGGEVPDLSEEVQQSEDEKTKNDILAQILQGWESKRGSEDIRMRASALSIFLTGMETNIAGMGATLIEASVDLSINILTMEPEMEKAILRRAAIILILTFVKALADARELGKRLGFGLTDPSREDILRILRYVAGTDNDGLVQEQARDVVESLENWQITSMLPELRDPQPGLTSIAGLDLNRPSLPLTEPRVRPKIEEIE